MTLKVGEKYWGTWAGSSQWLTIQKIMKLEDGKTLIKFRADCCEWFPWLGPVSTDSGPEFIERLCGGAIAKTVDEIEVLNA